LTGAALIIGGTGFVGRHLARRLEPRYAVTATGRERDIRDRDAMMGLVGEVGPDIVVNLAAITTVAESRADPRRTYSIGFGGLLNLLEALETHGFSGRLLLVSSSEVYGHPRPDELPLTESAPFRPMSPYAVAKAAGEMLCREWIHSAGFEIVMARPFTHIGPGQSRRFSVASFAYQIASIVAGDRPAIVRAGNLDSTRDLTDVRDVVRAYDLLLHDGEAGSVYNVCTGREVKMRDVLAKMIALSGTRIEISEDRSLFRTAEQQRLCGSPEALAACTGWAPEVSLDKTLGDILRQFVVKGCLQ
jgi:GDP-4-dehydro-6-deoxy-D-mannose reductase